VGVFISAGFTGRSSGSGRRHRPVKKRGVPAAAAAGTDCRQGARWTPCVAIVATMRSEETAEWRRQLPNGRPTPSVAMGIGRWRLVFNIGLVAARDPLVLKRYAAAATARPPPAQSKNRALERSRARIRVGRALDALAGVSERKSRRLSRELHDELERDLGGCPPGSVRLQWLPTSDPASSNVQMHQRVLRRGVDLKRVWSRNCGHACSTIGDCSRRCWDGTVKKPADDRSALTATPDRISLPRRRHRCVPHCTRSAGTSLKHYEAKSADLFLSMKRILQIEDLDGRQRIPRARLATPVAMGGLRWPSHAGLAACGFGIRCPTWAARVINRTHSHGGMRRAVVARRRGARLHGGRPPGLRSATARTRGDAAPAPVAVTTSTRRFKCLPAESLLCHQDKLAVPSVPIARDHTSG